MQYDYHTNIGNHFDNVKFNVYIFLHYFNVFSNQLIIKYMEGEKLKKILQDKQISITDFAEKVGLTRATIYNMFAKKFIGSALKESMSKEFDIDFDSYKKEQIGSKTLDDLFSAMNDLRNEIQTKNKQIEHQNGLIDRLMGMLEMKLGKGRVRALGVSGGRLYKKQA